MLWESPGLAPGWGYTNAMAEDERGMGGVNLQVKLVPPWWDCWISDRCVWVWWEPGGYLCHVWSWCVLTLLWSTVSMCTGNINKWFSSCFCPH